MCRMMRTLVALAAMLAVCRGTRAAEPDAAELAALIDKDIDAGLKAKRIAPAEQAALFGRMPVKVLTGDGGFGQGCLMARRLVEAGVPFVEVVMGDRAGWDTHRDNFPRTKALSPECDTAMAALVEDLKDRGLLDTTLVVWMGEFGRSPQCGGAGGTTGRRRGAAC